MQKDKYQFDSKSLEFKEIKTSWKKKLFYSFSFGSSVLLISIILIGVLWKYLESPGERLLRFQYNKMSENYQFVYKKFSQLSIRMKELEKRDNEIYRTIFEAPLVSDTIRSNFSSVENYFNSTDNEILTSVSKQISNLESRMSYSQESYEYIEDLISEKKRLLSSTPAIQPLSNKDLSRIASTYGVRLDPIYKIKKFHYGIDFSSPEGTLIYTTADGYVEHAGRKGGYGLCVIVNHGYNYKTLYAHMSKLNCVKGQRIKRGNVIGFVGNTGKSVAPHLHYEVIKNNKKINPINFFYNDITPDQYDKILELGESINQSLD